MSRVAAYTRVCWYVLTEVPGWPDAPLRARLWRAMPVVFPLLGVIAILGWQFGYYAPRIQEERTVLQPLNELESEISTLQLSNSDRQIADLAERAAAASRLLLDSPKDLPVLLKTLKKDIRDRGWDATFQTTDVADDSSPDGSLVAFLPVRAKFKIADGNTDPFSSFLGVLDRFSTSSKRIELTRLAIRADDGRWQTIEASLRLACPLSHAKAP